MPFPGPAYFGTSGNYPRFSHLLKHRHADQTPARFAEVQAKAWDALGHLLAPLPSRHCGSGTRGLQSSTCDVDTISQCLVATGLTLSCAEDPSAHFTPTGPSIDALSRLLPISPLQATCTLQPRRPRLLHAFSLNQGRRRRVFL